MCGALIFSVALIPPAILIIDKFGVWRRRIYTRQQGIVLQQTLPGFECPVLVSRAWLMAWSFFQVPTSLSIQITLFLKR
jgi:hypothetical protein